MTDAIEAARRKRHESLRTQTLADRQARHDRVAADLGTALDRRRDLGREYLQRHPPLVQVPTDRAVAQASMVAETAAARVEAARLASGRTARIHNGALEFPVLSHHFASDGPVLRLGTSEPVLSAVTAYFGMVPVLYNVFVTRAHTTELLPTTAHRFHLDPEDVVSCKVFVHLTEVDGDCGPLHVLPATASARVLETVDYRGIDYLDDDQIDDLVGWQSVVEVTGPPGTVAFADTTRCLHFGGRPRATGKPVREMLVYQYLLPTSTLMTGTDDEPPRRFLAQLAPTGDDAWDALLGHRFPSLRTDAVTATT